MGDVMNQRARERLRALAERWMVIGWQRGDADALVVLHAPSFVDFAAPAERAPTREGFAEGMRLLYAAFPDFFATIDDLVLDESTGNVAIRWSAEGTHRGRFMGFEPTLRRISFRGIEILHIVDDLIVERWGEWDEEDLQRQLASR